MVSTNSRSTWRRIFKAYKLAVVSIWPWPIATERAKSVLAKIPGGVKRPESAETPGFSGFAIA